MNKTMSIFIVIMIIFTATMTVIYNSEMWALATWLYISVLAIGGLAEFINENK